MTLLGGFEVRRADGDALPLPARKAQATLSYLALSPGQLHRRDKVATLLWGDRGEEQARHSLRQVLFTLRRAFRGTRPALLVVAREGLTLNPGAVEVDVALFERLAAQGTLAALERATHIYRGDLLEGFSIDEEPFEEWLRSERERLREMWVETLARLLALQTAAGATAPAIQTAIRLIALDPLQEVVHRALIRLYLCQGRVGAALGQYRACVEILRRELGAEPEPATLELHRRLRG